MTWGPIMSSKNAAMNKPPKQQNQKQNTPRQSRKSRNRNRRRQRRQNSFTRSLNFAPTSQSSTIRLYADIRARRDGTAHLSFCELFPITISQDGLSSVTLINPAKWIGTRTKDQALLYSQFRPIRINVSYVPTVGTNTPGLISFGAVYNNAYPTYSQELFMRLPQMAGGFITSLWQTATTNIPCSTKLFQNNFALSNVGEQDIPITLVTICNNAPTELSSPGYLCVYGTLSLSGPRAAPEIPSISGESSGSISVTNGQVTLTATSLNLVVGDTFQALITSNTLTNPTNVTNGPDWKKIFRVFSNIVCTVLEVSETILKIAVAVAPILLTGAENTEINALGTVGFTIIGRTDFQ